MSDTIAIVVDETTRESPQTVDFTGTAKLDGTTFQALLLLKSAISHNHDTVYTKLGITNTFWYDGAAATPAVTNGAAVATAESTTYKITEDFLEFNGTDESTDSEAVARIKLPELWDLGTLRIKVAWASKTGATAAEYVEWLLSINATSDGDVRDIAWSADVAVEDQVTAAETEQLSIASGEITVGNTPAAGDTLRIRIKRDHTHVGAGTGVAEKIRLLGLYIEYKETSTPRTPWS